MAFDAAVGRTVMYGGYASASPVTDTWEWNGADGTWTERKVSPPSAFDMMATTYDSGRGRMVLFGGETYPSASASRALWEWGGADGAWANRTPTSIPAVWPTARILAAAAYDPQRHRVVIHGGNPGDDTWEWDSDGGTWSNRSAAPSPERGGAEAFVWDPCRNRGILFGGGTGALWEWDGVGGQWTKRNPEGSTPWPQARSFAGMVFDTTVGRPLLFGGTANQQVFNDLWEWDGALGQWTSLDGASASARPAGRQWAGVAYDTDRSRLVVFGGGAETDLWDLWEWSRP
jgi:hypothetical protein